MWKNIFFSHSRIVLPSVLRIHWIFEEWRSEGCLRRRENSDVMTKESLSRSVWFRDGYSAVSTL